MAINPLTGKSKLAVQHSTATINVYEGSVRSGKTIATLIDWIRYCRNAPAGNLLMTGRTERTIINNLVLPIQEMLGKSRVTINRGNGTVSICGREVILVGANNEQARTKIQGLTLAGAYVDEASTLPESYWNMLTTRLSVDGARMWATCNPEGPRHWFKLQWLDKAKLWVKHDSTIEDRNDDFHNLDEDDPLRPIDLHRFSFTLEDNRPNLNPKYYANVMSMYSGLWYQRMILGLWTMAEGIVYDKFDMNHNVVDTLPPMEFIVGIGIDYGDTNPTRGIVLGVGTDQKLYAMAEWDPGAGTAGDRSRSLRKFLAQYPDPGYVVVDPAAKGFRFQLASDQFTNVLKANNSVNAGINTVGALFGTRQLLIHRSCTKLLDEIVGFVWDAKASEKGEDAVVKLDDHSVDGLRYIVHTLRHMWRPYVPTTALEEVAA